MNISLNITNYYMANIDFFHKIPYFCADEKIHTFNDAAENHHS